MRTKFLSSMLLAGVALLFAPPAARGAVVLSDDFNDGVFATHWVLTALSCGSPAETGGQLVMNKTASCAGGIAMTTDPGLYPIRGDFGCQIMLLFQLALGKRKLSFGRWPEWPGPEHDDGQNARGCEKTDCGEEQVNARRQPVRIPF